MLHYCSTWLDNLIISKNTEYARRLWYQRKRFQLLSWAWTKGFHPRRTAGIYWTIEKQVLSAKAPQGFRCISWDGCPSYEPPVQVLPPSHSAHIRAHLGVLQEGHWQLVCELLFFHMLGYRGWEPDDSLQLVKSSRISQSKMLVTRLKRACHGTSTSKWDRIKTARSRCVIS